MESALRQKLSCSPVQFGHLGRVLARGSEPEELMRTRGYFLHSHTLTASSIWTMPFPPIDEVSAWTGSANVGIFPRPPRSDPGLQISKSILVNTPTVTSVSALTVRLRVQAGEYLYRTSAPRRIFCGS
jgi:hypothetical protein